MASNPPTPPPPPDNFFEWLANEKNVSSQPTAGRAKPTPSSPQAGMSLREQLKYASRSYATIRKQLAEQKAADEAKKVADAELPRKGRTVYANIKQKINRRIQRTGSPGELTELEKVALARAQEVIKRKQELVGLSEEEKKKIYYKRNRQNTIDKVGIDKLREKKAFHQRNKFARMTPDELDAYKKKHSAYLKSTKAALNPEELRVFKDKNMISQYRALARKRGLPPLEGEFKTPAEELAALQAQRNAFSTKPRTKRLPPEGTSPSSMPMSASGEIKGPSQYIGKQNVFTPQDENLYYRAVKEPFNQSARVVIDDFLNTGQIRGSQSYGGEAYFARGAYWDPSKQWTNFGVAHDAPSTWFPGQPRSYQITVDPAKINASANPLYGAEAGWKNKYFDVPENFAITYNPTSTGQATYPVLQPAKEPGLFNTLNPLNRSGIKYVGNTGEIVYDRVTPFGQRPLSTHLANLEAESQIAINTLGQKAEKVAGSILPYASKVAKVAGPTLLAYDAYTRAEEGRARGDDPKVTGSTYTADAVANMATLGGWDFAKWYIEATPKEREQHWNTVGERLQKETESGWTY